MIQALFAVAAGIGHGFTAYRLIWYLGQMEVKAVTENEMIEELAVKLASCRPASPAKEEGVVDIGSPHWLYLHRESLESCDECIALMLRGDTRRAGAFLIKAFDLAVQSAKAVPPDDVYSRVALFRSAAMFQLQVMNFEDSRSIVEEALAQGMRQEIEGELRGILAQLDREEMGASDGG